MKSQWIFVLIKTMLRLWCWCWTSFPFAVSIFHFACERARESENEERTQNAQFFSMNSVLLCILYTKVILLWLLAQLSIVQYALPSFVRICECVWRGATKCNELIMIQRRRETLLPHSSYLVPVSILFINFYIIFQFVFMLILHSTSSHLKCTHAHTHTICQRLKLYRLCFISFLGNICSFCKQHGAAGMSLSSGFMTTENTLEYNAQNVHW